MFTIPALRRSNSIFKLYRISKMEPLSVGVWASLPRRSSMFRRISTNWRLRSLIKRWCRDLSGPQMSKRSFSSTSILPAESRSRPWQISDLRMVATEETLKGLVALADIPWICESWLTPRTSVPMRSTCNRNTSESSKSLPRRFPSRATSK